ncbi:hypothetical protein D3C87_1133490 [compost metagenome]
MSKDKRTKSPYTGPSQVVTTDTHRRIYVDVYAKARCMTVYAGNYYEPTRANLNPDKHPGLWAVVSLLCDPQKNQVAQNKFCVRLTLGELEAADPDLAKWVREQATKSFFARNKHVFD